MYLAALRYLRCAFTKGNYYATFFVRAHKSKEGRQSLVRGLNRSAKVE